jgi:hypothetical protein
MTQWDACLSEYGDLVWLSQIDLCDSRSGSFIFKFIIGGKKRKANIHILGGTRTPSHVSEMSGSHGGEYEDGLSSGLLRLVVW